MSEADRAPDLAAGSVDAIVVAAGTSSRMGGRDKLGATLAGHPVLARSVGSLAASPLGLGVAARIGADPLGIDERFASLYGPRAPSLRFASDDGRARLLLVRFRTGPDAPGAARAAVERIETLGRRQRGVTVEHMSAHAFTFHYARSATRDVSVLSSAGTALVLLVLLIGIRRPRHVLFEAVTLVATMAIATGVVGYTLGYLNQISAGAAAILAGIGDDNGVHLLLKIDQERKAGHGVRDAAARAIAHALKPALAATGSTIGVFSFIALLLGGGIGELGIVGAVGTAATLVGSFTILPALVVLFAAKVRLAEPAPAPAAVRPLSRSGRTAVLVVSALLAGLACVRLPQVRVVADPVALARQNLPPDRATQALARHFGRIEQPWVVVAAAANPEAAGRAGDRLTSRLVERLAPGWQVDSLSILWPSTSVQAERARRLAALDLDAGAARYHDALRAAGVTESVASEAASAIRALSGAASRVGPVPEPLRRWADRYRVRLGAEHHAILYVTAPAGTSDAAGRRAIERVTEGQGTVAISGYPAVRAGLSALLTGRGGLLLALSLFCNVALLLGTYRSATRILFVTAPVVLTCIVTVGVLQLAGIALSFFTLATIPLVFGLGLDNHAYLAAAIDEAGGDVARAASASRRAILTSSATTFFGFGALALSQMPGLRQLGIAAAAGVALQILSAVYLLPALASLRPRRAAV